MKFLQKYKQGSFSCSIVTENNFIKHFAIYYIPVDNEKTWNTCSDNNENLPVYTCR